MKTTTKVILALIVVALIAATVGYFQYNKPHRDAAEEQIAFSLSAIELFAAFDNDEKAAIEKFGNQLLEVTGNVREFTKGNSTGAMIVLESDHPIFGVKCMFQSAPQGNITEGTKVAIRGFCSGINGDVELTRCSLNQ